MNALLLAALLYVTNERAGTIQVIDTTTHRVTASAKLGNRPRGLALSPDGKRLYVALSWWRDGKRARSGAERIVALDAKTLKHVRDYPAGTDPECVAVSPDGQRLYLSNEDAATATIVDVATAKNRGTLVVGIEAWVSAEIGGSVALIDVAKHRPVKRIKLRANDKPVGLVLSPDERRLYVATGRGNSVAVIDTVAMKVIANIPTGERVWGIAITNDGKRVYAANSLANTISVIDTATNRVIQTLKTDDGPWGLALR